MKTKKIASVFFSVFFSIFSFSSSVFSEDILIPDISEGSKAFNALNDVLLSDEFYSDFIEQYGGAYIVDNSLFVYYKYSFDETFIDNLMNEKSLLDYDIAFSPSQYSYNELDEMMKSIWSQKVEGNTSEYHWTDSLEMIGINQSENCLDVFVQKCNDAQLTEISEHLNEYPVNLVLTDGYKTEKQTTINPGAKIYKGSTPYSVGFRCKKNGEKGFLTTFHSNTSNFTVTYNSQNIGTVSVSVDDGIADFSFVKLNSSYEVSLNPKGLSGYQLHSSHYAVALPTNYTVFMAGYTQSGVASGGVIYNSGSHDIGSDWLICSYTSNSGDSGGCVFTNVNGDYVVISIHDGRFTELSTQQSVAFSTKLTTIKNLYYSDITIY